MEAGDFFGEMALLGGKVRSASAQAVENSELLVINDKNFKKLLKSDFNFTLRLLYTLAGRLKQADEEIESLLFQNTLCRLAKALFRLSQETSQPVLKITVQELADYVGTTREPLSRALSVMRRSQIIECRDRQVVITDAKRLTAMAAKD